jgi:hypothetical protein
MAIGALQRVDFVDSLYARSPSAPPELTPIVVLLFFRWRRGELSSLTSTPTRVPSVISGDGFVGLRYVTGKLSKELQSVKLVSSSVFGSVGNDIVLNREFHR